MKVITKQKYEKFLTISQSCINYKPLLYSTTFAVIIMIATARMHNPILELIRPYIENMAAIYGGIMIAVGILAAIYLGFTIIPQKIKSYATNFIAKSFLSNEDVPAHISDWIYQDLCKRFEQRESEKDKHIASLYGQIQNLQGKVYNQQNQIDELKNERHQM